MVREVTDKYFNASEPSIPQITDRSVRSMARLFHTDELNWTDDLARVREICEKTGLSLAPKDIHATANIAMGLGTSMGEGMGCYCCCTSHHDLLCPTTSHYLAESKWSSSPPSSLSPRPASPSAPPRTCSRVGVLYNLFHPSTDQDQADCVGDLQPHVQWKGSSNINVMHGPWLYPLLHGTKGQGGAGTGHHLHWDHQLGGQRGQALGEGARQQDPWLSPTKHSTVAQT